MPVPPLAVHNGPFCLLFRPNGKGGAPRPERENKCIAVDKNFRNGQDHSLPIALVGSGLDPTGPVIPSADLGGRNFSAFTSGV